MHRSARWRGEKRALARESRGKRIVQFKLRFTFQAPHPCEQLARAFLSEHRGSELQVFVLELSVGERRFGIALTRGLQVLAAPPVARLDRDARRALRRKSGVQLRSEEHTSELQSQSNLVCRLLLEKKKRDTTSQRPRVCG